MPTSTAPTARFPSGLRITALDAGDVVVRIHQKIHGAIFFGPASGATPQGRFDAPAGQYRLLYAAQRLEGAFVETVLRRPANRIVRRAFVDERMWTPLRMQRQLVLAKLMDEGLLFHGVDASISAGADYARHVRSRWLCTKTTRTWTVWRIGPDIITARFAMPCLTVSCRATL